ncbi:MAG: EF-hand domain-containing protein [Planctomycetaceae bacterium]
MRETFDRLDLHHDGFIDQEEIRQMMERFRQGGPDVPMAPDLVLPGRTSKIA